MMSNNEAILRRLGLVLESDPEADSFPDDERTSFTAEDVAVNLAEARKALELAIRGALWDLRPTKAKEKALFRLLRDVLYAVAAALSAREETEAPPSNRGNEI